MVNKDYIFPGMVPHDTQQAVANSFDGSNAFIRIGDALDTILSGFDPVAFAYPLEPLPVATYVFALITVFQRREKLLDVDMAEAVRSRPEVRYALRLPLRHPNVPVSSLCRFRQLLYNDPTILEVFEKISERAAVYFGDRPGALQKGRFVIPESVCLRNRTNSIVTRMLEVLEALTAVYPDWMREVAPTYWYDRYHRSATKFVKTQLDRSTLEMILAIGQDMKYILDLAEQEPKIAELPEVQMLEEVFHENYEIIPGEEKIQWKATMCSVNLRTTLQMLEVHQA